MLEVVIKINNILECDMFYGKNKYIIKLYY